VPCKEKRETEQPRSVPAKGKGVVRDIEAAHSMVEKKLLNIKEREPSRSHSAKTGEQGPIPATKKRVGKGNGEKKSTNSLV